MVRPQNPFSLYDFLGYFIPGALGTYLCIFIYFHIIKGSFNQELFEQIFSVFNTHTYVPFVIVSYVFGHFLSYLSSITIEKYSVLQHGYPSKYLLGHSEPKYFHTDIDNKLNLLGRIFTALFIGPVTICDYVFGHKLCLKGLYLRPLDSTLTRVLVNTSYKIIDNVYPQEINNYNDILRHDDFFRICYHFALEKTTNHGTKMQNYVALFGFTRTITLILSIVAWAFFIHLILSFIMSILNISCNIDLLNTSLLFCLFTIIAYIFYMAFNKFFRRFSLEAMMAANTAFHFPPVGFGQATNQQLREY